MRDLMEGVNGYHPGSEMNGAAALLTERRLLLLEVGQQDLTRRVVAVEIGQAASMQADHQRDLLAERSSVQLGSFLDYFSKDFLLRFRLLEAEHKRVMIGLAMLGASGIVQGVKWGLGL